MFAPLPERQGIYVDQTLRLSLPNSQLAKEIFQIIDYNRSEFSKYMAWPAFVKTEDDVSSFFDNCLLAHQKNESKTYVILFNEKPVGIISFNSIDMGNKTAYIGYWLDGRKQKHGIMSRSVKALVKFYSDNSTIKRFVLKCSVNNPRSNNVAQRCGFELEGRLKSAELLNGIFHDQYIYGYVIP